MPTPSNSPLANSIGRFTKQAQSQQPQNPVSNSSSNLIRNFNDQQQGQWNNSLQIPKVQAPKLQEAAPRQDSEFQVTTPQAPSLEQMTAPIDSRPMTTPQYDVTAEFNQRLMQQIPTLYSGAPSDSQRRTNSFYDWLDGTIENNRKNEFAQAKMQQQLQNLAASNTTPGQRPNGFLSNVGKLLFGGESKTDDGVLGNEFDLKKLRFGQYGNGVVGGLMYGVDQTFGLGILRNSLLDTGAGLSSQAAGLFANGGLFSTLFKTGDVGQAIVAGDNRYKQAMRNIYGDKYTPFYIQGLQGRDLGALGNLSGDAKDDYYKMYGSSPVAAGLDKAFFGRELTEQESKDYEKLTGYSIKQAVGLEFSQKEMDDYNEILGRTPEDFKVKMMIRNAIGLASDISGDDYIKKAGTMARGAIERGAFERTLRNTLKGSEELPNEAPRLTSGSTDGLAGLLKAGDEGSTSERPLSLYEPPKRTPSEVTTPERRALKAPIIYEEPVVKGSVVGVAPNAIPSRSSVPRGNNPWVTIDTAASRVAPPVEPKAVERQLSLMGVPETPRATAESQLTQSLLKDLRVSETTSQQLALPSSSSGSKAMIASPVEVQTPRTPDVASILADQYKRQVTPGQYILQDLRTRASNDPFIQAKLVEPPAVVEKTIPFDVTKIEATATSPVAKTTDTPKAIAATPEVDVVKTIPSSVDELKQIRAQSKEELLKKAREFLEKQKKGEVVEDAVVESTKPVRSSATEGGVDWKKQQLAAAKERLQAEKAAKQQTTLTPVDAVAQMAVEAKAATPVQGGAELRVDVNKVEGAALLDEAVDLHSIFTKEYAIEDLDDLMSLAARKAAGAPLSFVGKVAPIGEVSRSQKEIYRFASLVPSPNDATKPLLPPTRSIVAEYEATHGVEHPFKAYAIQDGSMRNLTKRGGVRKHKSLEDIAAEQYNPLYRKILSPGSNPIPLQIIERFEQQYATSGKGLVRTSPDTVAQVAPIKATGETPLSVFKRNDAIAELEKRGVSNVKKNLSAAKLNDIIKHLDDGGDVTTLDQSFFKKATGEVKQSVKKAPTKPVEEPHVKQVEKAAKKVVSSQTIDEFEDAASKLDELEPSLEELDKIEKSMGRSAPIYDHRKKITSPAHNEGVDIQAQRNPEIAAKQKEHDNLTQQLHEVAAQEQKLQEAKVALDVAVDNFEAQKLAKQNKVMSEYDMTRQIANDFTNVEEALIAQQPIPPNSIHSPKWKTAKKGGEIEPTQLMFKDIWGGNLTTLRESSIDSGEYSKAVEYFFNDPLHRPNPPVATNPVIKFTRDGSLEFVSGRGTFFVMRDAGMESIPVQVVEDLRPTSVVDVYEDLNTLKRELKILKDSYRTNKNNGAVAPFLKNKIDELEKRLKQNTRVVDESPSINVVDKVDSNAVVQKLKENDLSPQSVVKNLKQNNVSNLIEFRKLYPNLSRAEQDALLYSLERADLVELHTLQEVIGYTSAEVNQGIPQAIGGNIFFIDYADGVAAGKDDLSLLSHGRNNAKADSQVSLINREELSQQNIKDAIAYYDKAVKPLIGSVENIELKVPKRRDALAAIPESTRDAMLTFRDAVAELRDNGGVMTPEIQIRLNNAVFAMEKYKTKTPNTSSELTLTTPEDLRSIDTVKNKVIPQAESNFQRAIEAAETGRRGKEDENGYAPILLDKMDLLSKDAGGGLSEFTSIVIKALQNDALTPELENVLVDGFTKIIDDNEQKLLSMGFLPDDDIDYVKSSLVDHIDDLKSYSPEVLQEELDQLKQPWLDDVVDGVVEELPPNTALSPLPQEEWTKLEKRAAKEILDAVRGVNLLDDHPIKTRMTTAAQAVVLNLEDSTQFGERLVKPTQLFSFEPNGGFSAFGEQLAKAVENRVHIDKLTKRVAQAAVEQVANYVDGLKETYALARVGLNSLEELSYFDVYSPKVEDFQKALAEYDNDPGQTLVKVTKEQIDDVVQKLETGELTVADFVGTPEWELQAREALDTLNRGGIGNFTPLQEAALVQPIPKPASGNPLFNVLSKFEDTKPLSDFNENSTVPRLNKVLGSLSNKDKLQVNWSPEILKAVEDSFGVKLAISNKQVDDILKDGLTLLEINKTNPENLETPFRDFFNKHFDLDIVVGGDGFIAKDADKFLFDLLNTIDKRNQLPVEIAIAQRNKINTMFVLHGTGATAEEWTALRRLTNRPEDFLGKRTMLFSCQFGCSRAQGLVPNEYVVDWFKDDQLVFWNVGNPEYARVYNKEQISYLADFKYSRNNLLAPMDLNTSATPVKVEAVDTTTPKIAVEMREVVRRLTGRTADEGQAFMPSAVELLNDNTKRWSRNEVADLVSYAVGTKDVRFAANLTDDEVLKFGRMIAAHPETMSRFDNVYVGHGTGVVEYGTWSLEARPQTGQVKRELIQHVIDREFPKGTEVGVAACETSCPKRIQDAVPLLHRVVSRGEAASAIERVQRGLEQLSDVPVSTKLQDFFASYEGMLREAMSANKERGLQIVQRMSELETEFEKVNTAALNAKRQRASELMRLEDARMSVEKELLNGDC